MGRNKSKAINYTEFRVKIYFKEIFKGSFRELAIILAASWATSFLMEIALLYAIIIVSFIWVVWLIYRHQELENKALRLKLGQWKSQYQANIFEIKTYASNEVRLKNEEIERLRYQVTSEQKKVREFLEKVTQLESELTLREQKVTHAEVKKEQAELEVTQLKEKVTKLQLEVTRANSQAERASAQVTSKVTEVTKKHTQEVTKLKNLLEQKSADLEQLERDSRKWKLGFIQKELGKLRKGKNNENAIVKLVAEEEQLKRLIERDQATAVVARA